MSLDDIFSKFKKKEFDTPDVKEIKSFANELVNALNTELRPKETPKGKILREHRYLESNIPVNHPYWQMKD